MTQTSPLCRNRRLWPQHTGHWWQPLRFLLHWNRTGWTSEPCLHVYSHFHPVLQRIGPRGCGFNASFQHLGSSPGAQPQTETTINSSTQNTFLRIHQPWVLSCDEQPKWRRPKWPHTSGLMWLTAPRTQHNMKTAGDHELHNVRGLLSWWAFISSSVIHHQPRGSLHPLTLSLSLIHSPSLCETFQSYFMMMWWHLGFSHDSGVDVGMSVSRLGGPTI